MSTLDTPVIPDVPVYKLSVDQYHEIVQSGALTSDDRVELLNGWMVPKVSNNPQHSVATELTVQALREVIPADHTVRSEKPITLSDSEPEPDAAVVVGSPRTYVSRHPAANEVKLIVEVADSTLNRDRQTKLQIYAAAGIQCYWIVDLVNRLVEVYTHPLGSQYLNREVFSDQVPIRIGDSEPRQIAVSDILP